MDSKYHERKPITTWPYYKVPFHLLELKKTQKFNVRIRSTDRYLNPSTIHIKNTNNFHLQRHWILFNTIHRNLVKISRMINHS
jgi:hypothetical protein